MSYEVDESKQFPVSLGGLGYKRAGDIALDSFHASLNSAGEFEKTIPSSSNIPDTDEIAKSDEWFILAEYSRCQKHWDLLVVKRDWEGKTSRLHVE